MGLTLTITDAATTYGLNDFSPSSTLNQIVGIAGSPTLIGNHELGASATMSILYASGFSGSYSYVILARNTATVTSATLKAPTGEVVMSAQGEVASNIGNVGNIWTDTASLYANADSITGNSAANKLDAFGGNDHIDGGGGMDTAVFQGLASQYTIARVGPGMTVTGPDGVDSLVNIERLQFGDETIAYDTAGAAGQAYRLYQAAFNRAPDAGGLGFWTHSIDNGVTLNDVARGFIASPEFSATYGGLDTTHFVAQLYQNVLHRAGDAGGAAFWSANLDAGALTRAETLALFSESPENQAALIAVIQNGMVFTG